MKNFGIDIGNKNTRIGYIKSGIFDILLNDQSKRSTKTLVSFRNNLRYFGEDSYNHYVNNYKNVISYFKNLNENKKYSINLSQDNIVDYDCITIMLMYSNYLFKIINNYSFSSKNLTLAIDNNFTINGNKLLKQCFNAWGYVHFITNSHAIALNYGYYKSINKLFNDINYKNVIFINLGEETADISLVKFKPYEFYISDAINNYELTGQNIKHYFINKIIDNINNKYKRDISKEEKLYKKIIYECDKALKKISINNKINIIIEDIEDIDINNFFLKEDFENHLLLYLNNLIDNVNNILLNNNFTIDNINSIELSGGISRIPIVKKILNKSFQNKIKTTLNTDECIVHGCTLNSGLISLDNNKFKIYNKNKEDIIFCFNNSESLLLKSDVYLPKRKKITLNIKDLDLKNIYIEFKSKNNYCKYKILGLENINITKIVVILHFSFYNFIEINDCFYNTLKSDTFNIDEKTKIKSNKQSKVKLIVEKIENNNIDFTNYETINDDFTKKELIIKKQNNLKNKLETLIYETNIYIIDNKYNKYLNDDDIKSITHTNNTDLNEIDNGFLDNINIVELEKKISEYNNIQIIYKKNLNIENDYNNSIKLLDDLYTLNINLLNNISNLDIKNIKKFILNTKENNKTFKPYSSEYILSSQIIEKHKLLNNFIEHYNSNENIDTSITNENSENIDNTKNDDNENADNENNIENADIENADIENAENTENNNNV